METECCAFEMDIIGIWDETLKFSYILSALFYLTYLANNASFSSVGFIKVERKLSTSCMCILEFILFIVLISNLTIPWIVEHIVWFLEFKWTLVLVKKKWTLVKLCLFECCCILNSKHTFNKGDINLIVYVPKCEIANENYVSYHLCRSEKRHY
jgi:hypothetical protein